MKTNFFTSTTTWSWIGKAATLVGLLYGLYQLLGLFESSDFSVEAYGEHQAISVPSSFVISFETFRDYIQVDSISARLEREGEKPLFSSAYSIHQYFDSAFPKDVLISMKFTHSQWSYSITNTGSKEIRDPSLDLPFDGFYTIVKNGKESVSGSFAKTISLGPIRPRNSIGVIVWTSSTSEAYQEHQTRITHADGYFDIDYSVPVRGVLAWIDNHSPIVLSMLFSCALVLIAVLLSPLFSRANPKQNAGEAADPRSHDSEKGQNAS